MKEWIIDLGSFTVEAETEEEALDLALEMINDGWAEIDQIFEADA